MNAHTLISGLTGHCRPERILRYSICHTMNMSDIPYLTTSSRTSVIPVQPRNLLFTFHLSTLCESFQVTPLGQRVRRSDDYLLLVKHFVFLVAVSMFWL
jgi:hypothetical protein